MIEGIRWMALAIALCSFCISSYSLWTTMTQNRRLSRRNMELFIEKVDLWKKIEEYEAEILRLRKLLEGKD